MNINTNYIILFLSLILLLISISSIFIHKERYEILPSKQTITIDNKSYYVYIDHNNKIVRDDQGYCNDIVISSKGNRKKVCEDAGCKFNPIEPGSVCFPYM